MNKGIKGWDELVSLKEKEIEEYCTTHIDIIGPFLYLRKELEDLKSKAINARMNELDNLLKKKPLNTNHHG